jgi:hypothetical protein
MSVLGAMSRKDQAPVPVPKLTEPPDTTGFFQNVGAGFEAAKAGPHSTRNARAIYESRYYDQIVQALNAEGERATDYVESPLSASSPLRHPVPGERIQGDKVFVPVQRSFANPFSEAPSITKDVNPLANFYLGGDPQEMSNIWGAVQRVRQRKPGFLKEFGDSAALDALAQKQREAEQTNAQAVTSRATTLGRVGAFIGGAAGSIASGDPENAVGGFASTGAKAAGRSVARQIIRSATEGAAINAAAGTAALPGQEADAERMGQAPMTTGEMARSVGENALAGAVLGSAHVTVPALAGATGRVAGAVVGKVAEHLPAEVRDPIVAASIRAATVKDRGLLYEFQRAHNPYSVADTSTPTEKAAAHTVLSDVETQEQSPLQPQHAGENDDRLTAVAKALGVDLAPQDTPSTAPIQTPTVRDRSEGAPAPRRSADYQEAVGQAEGTGKNPDSSADGYFQFTKGTWLEYAPKVTDTAGMSPSQILALRHDKGIASAAEQRFRADNATYLRTRGIEDSPGNLSLAHFLGKADAAKVLKADPSTPIERVIDPESFAANRNVLAGKSADEVIAWAHKRIGAAVDHVPARPDAVPDEGFDYAAPVPYATESLKPDEVTTNAEIMQYKSGGDSAGVTDALKGVEAWNPVLSQQILVWEPKEGGRIVVDGHQRVGLARRLYEDDKSIELPAIVIREADGITARQARTLGALRNIANGTGTLVDNARVLRDAPDAASMLPRNAPLARDSMGLAHLSYEAFGAAVNEVVPPHIAAQVGLNAPNSPEAHMPIIGLLAKERISNPAEAAAITRQALADGFGRADAEQLSLLGAEPQQSLYVPVARITAAAAKRLREEKRTFKVLGTKAGRIEAAGNVLDKAANESKVIGSDEALAILERTAHSAGPVRDALIAAARAELSGARRTDAVNQFLDALQGIDLRAAAAGVGQDGGAREPLGGAGRDLAFEAADADVSARGQPSLFDTAVAARESAERFSDPVGPEAKQQTALLEHDLRQDAGEPRKAPEGEAPKPPEKVAGEPAEHLFDLPSTGFRVSEDGEAKSIGDILNEADADEAAAKALRDCL